ncbi:MAG: FG-GAP repeat protein [Planctomycetes bacterium]|nr:FG-GAP repeat protein [Planctomycetota bacterium]
MSTSTFTQRGQQPSPRRWILSLALGALALLAGCHNGTNSGDGSGGQSDTIGAPTLSTVVPGTGAPSGGTLVTITGSGFLTDVTGATQVSFGGVAATNVVVLDDATLTAVTPPGSANDDVVAVEVTNSRGVGSLVSGFHYLATFDLVSDLNADGYPDLVVSAAYDSTGGAFAGSVYVFFGGAEVSFDDLSAADADVKIVGGAGDRFGSSLVSGDLDGDGDDDLAIGAPFEDLAAADGGSVRIFLGPLSAGTFGYSDADVVLAGEGSVAGDPYGSTGDLFGEVMSIGDANGDAVLDLLVGAPGVDVAPHTSAEIEDAGRAYVFHGGLELVSRGAADADVVLSGELRDEAFGSAVCLADVNGDGMAEAAVAGQVTSPLLYVGGYVHVFSGAGMHSVGRSAATWRLEGEAYGDRFGSSITCGLLDGDGIEDLIVGAPRVDGQATDTGAVYTFLGGPGFHGGNAGLASAIYDGQLAYGRFGSELASADVNGDGHQDVMVGAPNASFGAIKNGRVYVFFGSDVLVDELSEYSDVIYTGESIEGGRFGSAIEVLDYDRNGVADLMSSALGLGQAAGRVYVFRGADVLLDTEAVDDDLTLTGESEGGNFGFSISRGK